MEMPRSDNDRLCFEKIDVLPSPGICFLGDMTFLVAFDRRRVVTVAIIKAERCASLSI